MERMAANRLRWWLESNQRLNKFQSGFRQRRSTIDQIMRLADDAHIIIIIIIIISLFKKADKPQLNTIYDNIKKT